ncbi:hypothetical protein PIB30_063438 [Stylosanthes scabra]|uniref:Uncharacterized protein n=1 Tax=Stylosanthes scabra TaxID=79078 RepID=A0ABU6XJX9_9FABA|nr:hypothetical protein [Stylosanthes scabra]
MTNQVLGLVQEAENPASSEIPGQILSHQSFRLTHPCCRQSLRQNRHHPLTPSEVAIRMGATIIALGPPRDELDGPAASIHGSTVGKPLVSLTLRRQPPCCAEGHTSTPPTINGLHLKHNKTYGPKPNPIRIPAHVTIWI